MVIFFTKVCSAFNAALPEVFEGHGRSVLVPGLAHLIGFLNLLMMFWIVDGKIPKFIANVVLKLLPTQFFHKVINLAPSLPVNI